MMSVLWCQLLEIGEVVAVRGAEPETVGCWSMVFISEEP